MPETAVAASAPRTVLFDFDGVLIHGDAFELFIRERFRRSLVRKCAALLTLPWMTLLWPFSRRLALRALVHAGLLGSNAQNYVPEAEAFAGTLVRRKNQFSREGLHALRRHQAAGERVIVVTGCEQVLVTSILSQLGLTGVEILASQLYPGALGMRVKQHNFGRRKLKSLTAAGVKEWQVAYTDSLHDVPMLKPAADAVLVNGTPKLCKRMEKALGRTVRRVEWY